MDLQDWVGREQVQRDVLTPAHLVRFGATIDADVDMQAAPQGIHWTLCTPEVATAALDGDGHPMRGGFLPPVPLPRRMWASSEVDFHAPIAVGAQIERRSTIASVTEKSGDSGALVFVTIDHATFADDILCVGERQTLVYREASNAPPPEIGPEEPELDGWEWHRALTPSPPLLFRYSAMTFNSHRIHYDEAYAREVERYRGLVVHGPLTATLLLDLAGRHLGANRLVRFEFRGVSPAIAGEVLHLVGKMDADAVVLGAMGSDGRVVMTASGGV